MFTRLTFKLFCVLKALHKTKDTGPGLTMIDFIAYLLNSNGGKKSIEKSGDIRYTPARNVHIHMPLVCHGQYYMSSDRGVCADAVCSSIFVCFNNEVSLE